MKNARQISLILLIASFATVQQSAAQVPCGPTIVPKAALFVNWSQFGYDSAHTNCNPYESILSVNTVGNLTTKWQYQAGDNHVTTSPAVANGVVYFGSSPIFSSAILMP